MKQINKKYKKAVYISYKLVYNVKVLPCLFGIAESEGLDV